MSANVTKAGSYQDQAAGYYAAGGLSMRTARTSFNPVSMTAPSLNMSCSGIDAHFGSFALISGAELVKLLKDIGSQGKSYAFQLGLKTFAPQIENTLKDLRNLAMDLNQFAKGDCELTKAAFAAALPRDSMMRESVCKDMKSQSGMDYFGAGKECRNDTEQKRAIGKAQTKDEELMLDDYNIFTKAADKAGIPKDMRDAIMSMTGTLVMKDRKAYFYDSLAKDHKSWVTHLKGGESASLYRCNDSSCLEITLTKNIAISANDSYQGKAKSKLDEIKVKFVSNTEFNNNDIGFLSSIGDAFPIYDYISLEAISGVNILDSSSELVASYSLVQHLKEVTSEIRKAVAMLRSKQIEDQHLRTYEKALDRVQMFAGEKWSELLTNADRINKRARLIEQHLIVRERS
jgi:conjugative transfer pilus assembly protein TraH